MTLDTELRYRFRVWRKDLGAGREEWKAEAQCCLRDQYESKDRSTVCWTPWTQWCPLDDAPAFPMLTEHSAVQRARSLIATHRRSVENENTERDAQWQYPGPGWA